MQGSEPAFGGRERGVTGRGREPASPRGAFYEDLCFDAQQAAEKGIKAVLRGSGGAFACPHDRGELLQGLADSAVTFWRAGAANSGGGWRRILRAFAHLQA